MADFTFSLQERIVLDGTQRGTDYTLVITGAQYVDNRILNIPSGSETTLFSLSDVNSAGTFVTSSLKYARISNHSTIIPINLNVSSSNENLNFSIAAGGTFLLSTSEITGSMLSGSGDAVFTYDDIVSLKTEPSSSAAKVEYFIVTT